MLAISKPEDTVSQAEQRFLCKALSIAMNFRCYVVSACRMEKGQYRSTLYM